MSVMLYSLFIVSTFPILLAWLCVYFRLRLRGCSPNG